VTRRRRSRGWFDQANPDTGVVGRFKQSGLGRELGPDALDAFTETRNVLISTAEINSQGIAKIELMPAPAVVAGGPAVGRWPFLVP
jgi:hypothetical protein